MKLRATTIDGTVEILFQDLGASGDEYLGDYISMFSFEGNVFVSKTPRNIRGCSINEERERRDCAALRSAGVLTAYIGPSCFLEHPDIQFIRGDFT